MEKSYKNATSYVSWTLNATTWNFIYINYIMTLTKMVGISGIILPKLLTVSRNICLFDWLFSIWNNTLSEYASHHLLALSLVPIPLFSHMYKILIHIFIGVGFSNTSINAYCLLIQLWLFFPYVQNSCSKLLLKLFLSQLFKLWKGSKYRLSIS